MGSESLQCDRAAATSKYIHGDYVASRVFWTGVTLERMPSALAAQEDDGGGAKKSRNVILQ